MSLLDLFFERLVPFYAQDAQRVKGLVQDIREEWQNRHDLNGENGWELTEFDMTPREIVLSDVETLRQLLNRPQRRSPHRERCVRGAVSWEEAHGLPERTFLPPFAPGVLRPYVEPRLIAGLDTISLPIVTLEDAENIRRGLERLSLEVTGTTLSREEWQTFDAEVVRRAGRELQNWRGHDILRQFTQMSAERTAIDQQARALLACFNALGENRTLEWCERCTVRHNPDRETFTVRTPEGQSYEFARRFIIASC